MMVGVDEAERWENFERIETGIEIGLIMTLAQASLAQAASQRRDEKWTKALRRVLRADAARRADQVMGKSADARRGWESARTLYELKYGSGSALKPDAITTSCPESWSLAAADSALADAEFMAERPLASAYVEAVRDLFLLPAPDEIGVQLKIELYRAYNLSDALFLERSAHEIITDDLCRLLAEEAA